MKKSLILVLIVFFVLLVSGCSNSNPSGNTNSTGNSAATVSPEDAKIEALITEKLQNHHDMTRILTAQHTREEWNATLDRMISYGAVMTDAEKQQIIDWLLSRNP